MCDCISKVNKKLEPTGMELPIALTHVDNTLQLSISIPLLRIDGGRIKKADQNKIMPTYCPFCGVKIDMIAEAKRLHAEADAKRATETIAGALPLDLAGKGGPGDADTRGVAGRSEDGRRSLRG